ncbi:MULTISPECIES: hypothetical protein [Vibrio]|jgi:hypothetical protein|uniref:Uncharacterized protein n=2 Tax=Vibrio mediterranei TaxID=689 RepID=A0A3G4VHL0_9VIBR|nr:MULTISPECIES: hypothetical protein [Vibrio]AYV23845.1 hypothetical protein ECB94_21445 [Vibrio mediterranei]EDL54878.1 hypothetical protein VSAK1_19169 [Vibrio mediterranei AK1]MDA0107110.1 hypothetical protein [Vibrio sp. La 4.2.2]NOH29739.1 hypothetical protein [Vibrio mediterranei]NUW74381.1 hypothetical protein [Vibrio mediterranei]
MKTKLLLISTLTSIFMMGCTSTQEFLNENQSMATEAAMNRAKFELSCQTVQTTVLNKKTIDLYRYEVPQYQVGVSGCGKKVVYLVNCNPDSGCMVYDNKNAPISESKSQ